MFWTIAAVLLIPCLLVLQHARGQRLIHVLVVVALMVIVFNQRQNLKHIPSVGLWGELDTPTPLPES
jgi:hypothetical protein